jgi:hypothetical protein
MCVARNLDLLGMSALKKPQLHDLQSLLLCSHLQQAGECLFGPSFETPLQSTTLPAPTNGRVRLKVPQTGAHKRAHLQEVTMRNFTSIVVSVILAAGVSGMFFSATLV